MQAKKRLSSTLKAVIRNNQDFHPCSDQFKYDTFICEVFNCLDLQNEPIESECYSELQLIIGINKYYKSIKDKIIEILNRISLSKLELLKICLTIANYETLKATADVNDAIKENLEFNFNEFEYHEQKLLKNIFGEGISLENAADANVDICNLLLRLIACSNYENSPNKNNTEIQIDIKKCMFLGGLVHNIATVVDQYIYEFTDLTENGKDILFKYEPTNYWLLRHAGKERFMANIQANSHLLNNNVNATSKESAFQITKGCISFKLTGNLNHNPVKLLGISLEITFYSYLRGAKLKPLSALEIRDIITLLCEIQFLFQKIIENLGSKIPDKSEFNELPLFLDKKSFINHLHKLSGVKEKQIEKLLQQLSSDFSVKMNLWKAPLISYSTRYFINLAALASTNLGYWLEQIIAKVISQDDRNTQLCRHLEKDILSSINLYRKSPSIDIGKNTLLFELNNTLLIVQPCVTPFTFQSSDFNKYLTWLNITAGQLIETQKRLNEGKDNNENKIIYVIATDLPLLSGFNIEGCYVLDQLLLSNYFDAGKYEKYIYVGGQDHKVTRKISAHIYYKNEDEKCNLFESFCSNPYPILEKITSFEIKQFPIGVKIENRNVFQDIIEKNSFTEIIFQQVREVEFIIRQLYYFDSKISKDLYDIYQNRISYLLPIIMTSISLKNDDRLIKNRVLKIFKNIGDDGLFYLIRSFQNSISQLNAKFYYPRKVTSRSELMPEKAKSDLEQLIKRNRHNSLSLSELNLECSLSKRDKINVIEYLIVYLSTIGYEKYSEKEVETFYIYIIIFSTLIRDEEDYKAYLFQFFANYVDALNYNYFYQNAKNFSEEALEFSFKYEDIPQLGWLCLYLCFLKQGNILNAAFYGTLYINSISASPGITESTLSNALYYSILFFRNFNFPEIEKSIMTAFDKLELTKYEKQKLELSHFVSRLMNIEARNITILIQDIEAYLNANIEDIIKYGEEAAIPWLSLLHNFKYFKENNLINDEILALENFIIAFEKEVSSSNLNNLKAKLGVLPHANKNILLEGIKGAFKSNSYEDAAFELESLKRIATMIAENSIKEKNFESLLLTGLILNDQSLIFPKRNYSAAKVPFRIISDMPLLEHLEAYEFYIKNSINLTPGQLVLWLFSLNNKIFLLQINSHLEMSVNSLENWKIATLIEKLPLLHDLKFDDKGGSFSINEQEQDYYNVLNISKFAKIELISEAKELLIYTNDILSSFPTNLLQLDVKQCDASSVHNDMVKEFIIKHTSDFASVYKPITNIVSLEWFMKRAKVEIRRENLTYSCWVPIEDEDYALNIGFEKIRHLIENRSNGKVFTNIIPPTKMSSTVNIFMAHGGKGTDGFRTFYTRQQEGAAYLKSKGTSRIIGTGVVAVVFICYSAQLSPEMYSQKITSFAHEVISKGYSSVIAPSWAYNPIMSGVWLSEFIEKLESGMNVSQCVFEANQKVMFFGYNEYHGFFSPSGWAAMHLYGDPNVKVV